MHKVMVGTGFILVILGIGLMDSASMLIPVTMIAAGAVLILASARLEAKWKKE